MYKEWSFEKISPGGSSQFLKNHTMRTCSACGKKVEHRKSYPIRSGKLLCSSCREAYDEAETLVKTILAIKEVGFREKARQ